MARGANGAWAFPIVGLIIGGILALVVWGLGTTSLPPLAVGILVVALGLFLTGAMHEDGLSDTLDGFWGGWTPDSRLEIMKDSRLGVYGTAGLITTLTLKAVLIGALTATPWGLIGAAALSRGWMPVVMAWVPNARTTGLSRSVGQPTKVCAVTALAIGALAAAFTVPVLAIALSILVVASVVMVARRKIGGQTGDVLGACQVTSELCILLVCVAACRV